MSINKFSDTPTESEFVSRHIGPDNSQIEAMTKALGYPTLDQLVKDVVPAAIRLKKDLQLGHGVTETEVLFELKELSSKNHAFKNYIGLGYWDVVTPPVIQRNILENPGWYTQYTPYQAEIAQGRLEALLNFQTLVSDLTGLPVSNASLLDEATAAAEAMAMVLAVNEKISAKTFFVSEKCFPQTIAVVQTRAKPLDIKIIVGNPHAFDFDEPVAGFLLPYPDGDGVVEGLEPLISKIKSHNALTVVTADLLSLALLKSPGSIGADIAVGSAQRLGVPPGFGGPHAAYMATRDEFKRKLPGRIVGVSKDAQGNPAIRLALQTREQHIRREKATSNICTSQVLLAVMASMYAVYHGPQGLRRIAERIHKMAVMLKAGLTRLGFKLPNESFFDTIRVALNDKDSFKVASLAASRAMNFLQIHGGGVSLTVDETTTERNVEKILKVFYQSLQADASEVLPFALADLKSDLHFHVPAPLLREVDYLSAPVFNTHHSETEMLRYIRRLEAKDLSLTTSMIPLGSCTMKLNASAEMMPVTWEGFSKLHPFAPREQTLGYLDLTTQLERWLEEITGFAAVSLQPNAGSQGEYAGLLVIRQFFEQKSQAQRNICLIPSSAHGTNPASAVMAGFKVIVVKCDASGNVDVEDLKLKAQEHEKDLACLMITYPSTHGVFEEGIREICDIVHRHGGQVYMDGANMNAQVGLCRPGDFGADVCHLNLHKTFCIPHGGGGPGMGPIGVAAHLKDFLPRHPLISVGGEKGIGAVSGAPWGSASILPISYAYIRMMGSAGLKKATQVAILNANYIAKKLNPHFPVLFSGKTGLVAHECIIDLRPLKVTSGVEVEDVAKRLMDYGFHAPTVSFPVPGTMMIEPTESESTEELDRFCEAMILIREEIRKIEEGKWDRKNNPLKNAPHTAALIAATEWNHPYSREEAAFPAAWIKDHKFWPPVARIDNTYGDRNLICTCGPVEEFAKD